MPLPSIITRPLKGILVEPSSRDPERELDSVMVKSNLPPRLPFKVGWRETSPV